MMRKLLSYIADVNSDDRRLICIHIHIRIWHVNPYYRHNFHLTYWYTTRIEILSRKRLILIQLNTSNAPPNVQQKKIILSKKCDRRCSVRVIFKLKFLKGAKC